MNARPLEFDIRGNNKSRRAFKEVRNDVQSLRKTFAAGLGVGILSAELVQLPRIVRGVVAEASNLAKVADKVGLPVEDLQRLQFGFQLAGVEVRATNMALQRFSRRVGQAANGSGELYKIFEANGIQLREQDGTLRSQKDILFEYANLIKNAGSEQEKLLLAFKAFDREGAALVNGLRNGAIGLQKLERNAAEAGGVLEEEISRRAEEIDDKFARLWRTWEMASKSAILSTAAALDRFISGSGEALNLKDVQADLVRQRNSLTQEISLARLDQNEARQTELESQLQTLDARIQGVQVERRLRAMAGGAGPSGRGGRRRSNETPTVIPSREAASSGTAGRSSSALTMQSNQYDRVIDQLRQEAQLVRLSAVEQRKMNALRMAGVEATSEQGRAITALIDQLHGQTQAQTRVNEATGYFGGIASNQIGSFIQQLGFADTAAGRLASSLAEAALQAALLGQGPLSGLMGGGGLLPSLMGGFKFGGFGGSSLASSFAGMYADGGTLGAGQWGIAGEDGPEPVLGPAKVISNRDVTSGGEAKTVVYMTVKTQDAESFKRSETQISGRLVDAINRGKRGR